jgi:hypothetical protein
MWTHFDYFSFDQFNASVTENADGLHFLKHYGIPRETARCGVLRFQGSDFFLGPAFFTTSRKWGATFAAPLQFYTSSLFTNKYFSTIRRNALLDHGVAVAHCDALSFQRCRSPP